ncbi:hypothetical protein CANINC_003948 [Pichia inconspicua]|uniref:Amino acid permease/ SLC12A domain-containing protein n=1 Tax=Pichia inconspicua TaxID=52247 RepID=A0A4T0WXR5_9ASCO|nr:hypothetical protein CANINC_003948 [[Candida] inconspicua]
MSSSKENELHNYSTTDSKATPTSVAFSEGDDGSLNSKSSPYENAEAINRGFFHNFIDSFKPIDMGEIDPNLTDVEKAAIIAARSPLNRGLKNRHVQMIAIGGAIGTGLFVGSGTALRNGGPASLIICYFIVGSMIFTTVQSLGEMAVAFPIAGGFLSLNSRFISPAWGFCMAWNYAMQWVIVMPLELVAASLTIKYWNDSINSAAWVTIFYFVILFVNIFGVKGYGEAEFWFSTIKILAIVGFCIFGIIINCGGGPNGHYIGGEYWHNPGAFNHGFKGLCTVFVTAAFSFSGTELVGLTAAETPNPRKTLPSATKQVFWRIALFYITSLTIVGLLVPHNDPKLLSDNSNGKSASPFVIAITRAGIKGLPSVINVVILLAVLSVANAAVFACSRCIATLGDQGFAPKWFGYIDRNGRPMVGIAVVFTFGLLCYLAASPKEATAFAWMMSISGLSSLFTWSSICIAHIRFRHALKSRGRDPKDELSFMALTGVWGSYWSVILNILILIAEFWVALFPTNKADAYSFFENYLNPIVLVFFMFIYFCMKKGRVQLVIPTSELDVDTGRKFEDMDLLRQEIEDEKLYIKSKPFYYKMYKFWC